MEVMVPSKTLAFDFSSAAERASSLYVCVLLAAPSNATLTRVSTRLKVVLIIDLSSFGLVDVWFWRRMLFSRRRCGPMTACSDLADSVPWQKQAIAATKPAICDPADQRGGT